VHNSEEDQECAGSWEGSVRCGLRLLATVRCFQLMLKEFGGESSVKWSRTEDGERQGNIR